MEFAFAEIKENTVDSKIQEKQTLILAKDMKMLRVFKHIRRNIKAQQIDFAVSHPMQLRCALIWLEHSFGPMMNEVWEEMPKQKVTYLKEV